MSSPKRSAMVLATSAGLALIVLSVIDSLTSDRIAQARKDWMLENISAVLPEGPFDQNPVDSRQLHVIPALGSTEPLEIYTAYQNGQPAAVVLEIVTKEGYSGQIRLLLGLRPDGSVVAVRTLEHKETPGLGDGIEHHKSEWINQFESRSIASSEITQWQLKPSGGSFDGLTGATITSNAVLQAIHRALKWYAANRDQIFDMMVAHD